jgi:hypothetical protein
MWLWQGSMDDVDSLQGLAGDADEMDEPLSVRRYITSLQSIQIQSMSGP